MTGEGDGKIDSVEDRKRIKAQRDMLKDLIGPLLHTETPEEEDACLREFFEHRDDTVADAQLLAQIIVTYMIAMAEMEETIKCHYFHHVLENYDRRLSADLN